MVKSKKTKRTSLLVYLGVAIVVGWIVAMIAINNDYLRGNTLLISAPIALGWTLVSIGILKAERFTIQSALAAILLTALLTWLCVGFMAFLFVGRYGIGY